MNHIKQIMPRIKRQWKILAVISPIIVLLIILLIDFFFFIPHGIPFPPERTFKEYRSPDGTMVARFTWKPVGIMGAIEAILVDNDSNPMVYVTVIDSATGEVLIRESMWGDIPQDAVDRLWCHVPWTLEYSFSHKSCRKEGEFIDPPGH